MRDYFVGAAIAAAVCAVFVAWSVSHYQLQLKVRCAAVTHGATVNSELGR
jgi:hypothetical protein